MRLVEERNRPGAVALGLVGVELAVRVAAGGPYPGATVLLLAACGVALLPLVPPDLATPTTRAALVPAFALAAFSALLTTVSLVGVALDDVSVRLAVGAFVVAATAVAALGRRESDARRETTRRGELLGLAALGGIVAFALASSWDIVYPLQARGTDWGHYLLYAEEVAAQRHLLIDDPLAGEEGRIFADPPAVGSLYGSFLVLDGLSSWSLGAGIVVVSALTVLSVYAVAAGLWGSGAGLVAAAAYAVAPIRLDTMYWHGLGTSLALLYLPLVVLALGRLYRGLRDRHTVALLAVALVGVGAAHATSAVVAAALVLVAPLVDLAWRLGERRGARLGALRSWWSEGVVRPVAVGAGLACLLGIGVVAHLWLQTRELGRPVHHRFLGPDWLNWPAVEGYYGTPFLVLAAAAAVVALTSRRLLRDRALLALASLALACVVVSQLWRVGIPYEYRRVVYYLAVAMVLLVGVAFLRRRASAAWVVVFVLAFAYVARDAVGLRLPERVLRSEPRDAAVSGLGSFRERLDRGELSDGAVVVDYCLHFAVPYLVRRPTLPAFDER